MSHDVLTGSVQLSLLEAVQPTEASKPLRRGKLTVLPYLDFQQNQSVQPFIDAHLTWRAHQNDVTIEDSFGLDVRAGKNTSIYDAHTYHTKVPR